MYSLYIWWLIPPELPKIDPNKHDSPQMMVVQDFGCLYRFLVLKWPLRAGVYWDHIPSIKHTVCTNFPVLFSTKNILYTVYNVYKYIYKLFFCSLFDRHGWVKGEYTRTSDVKNVKTATFGISMANFNPGTSYTWHLQSITWYICLHLVAIYKANL